MKTKWLKAFRSLKPASGSAPADRRNGAAGSSSQPLRPNEDGSHHLQEYTYKKITACDVCSQILRGHTRQGLRCRICKLNAHGDCASQLPRCQPKQKLLRRQKSTSELENRVDVEEENYRLSLGNAAAIQMPLPPSMASLPTSAYISGGIGINYYTATQPPSATLKNNVLAYQQQQQQQQLLQQQLLQQQAQALPQPGAAAGAAVAATAAATSQPPTAQQPITADSGMRRRLFAGFRPLSGFGRLRSRSSQHRSISLPESNYNNFAPTAATT